MKAAWAKGLEAEEDAEAAYPASGTAAVCAWIARSFTLSAVVAATRDAELEPGEADAAGSAASAAAYAVWSLWAAAVDETAEVTIDTTIATNRALRAPREGATVTLYRALLSTIGVHASGYSSDTNDVQ